MPACYAHYRFGFRVLPALEPEVADLIRRSRQMYDLGLHGPDIFFYHNPFFAGDRLYRLATQTHELSGREFFSRAARSLRLEPDEGAAAYLYGVLAHFALDSACHPFVCAKAREGIAGHIEMETEFDRFLLELDHKPLPHQQDIYHHIRLAQPADAARIARFYPKATARQVTACLRNMRLLGQAVTAPEGPRRQIIGSGLIGSTANESMMTLSANLRCKELTPELYLRYSRAEKSFPALARQLRLHLARGEKLGAEFEPAFG